MSQHRNELNWEYVLFEIFKRVLEMNDKFTGYITVNYNEGGITAIEKFERIAKKKLK